MKIIKCLFTAVLLLCVAAVSAEDFSSDGIYYNITSSTDKTVEVTYRGDNSDSYSNEYSGSVTIPSTVTYNGTTYSVTSIRYWAFYNCDGLTSIVIPNSVTSIGGYAFIDCSGLASITIPNSVTSIGEWAFFNCSGLTSITIPNSVTSIGNGAFASCRNLTSISVDAGNTKYDSRNNCNAVIETETNTLIIGFKNTVIPNSVTSIGDEAFYGCDGLTSIVIPNSVTSIGYRAFHDTAWYNSQPDGLFYIGNVLYTYKGTMPENTSVTIKDGTLAIAGGAFEDCDGLTSVIIPNSVTSIGESAFRYCDGLTSIVIPNSVTSIGESAFRYCYGLTSVIIPNSVTSIGEYTFAACYGLISVTIGNGVTIIGYDAFYNCSGLKEVHISDLSAWCKIKFYGTESNPLFYAGNLYLNGELVTELVVPNDITEIKDYAFYNCSGLTSIEISNSVTSIGSWAFDGCSGLTSVKIGNNVTSIGNGTFRGCGNISKVEIESDKDISFYSMDTFNDNVYNNAILYVPKGRKEYYERDSYWSKFQNIEEVAYKVTYIVDGNEYKTIELGFNSPLPADEPAKEGYTFNGWENLPATMPANDIIVYGSYTINKYTITYLVDGQLYKSETYEYGAKIPDADILYKKGYIFSGWFGLPSTMPARNIIVTANFTLDTTAIESIEGEAKDRIVYDLNGNRIYETENLERGVYIVDGVKVMVR